ncbi:MAG: hypothetical protein M1167_03245, partial [Chloroflexi bacterium]|nr:hypothetical protein [Chloroflexota bacterium]
MSDTIQTLPEGKNSQNIDNLKKEFNEISKAYTSLNGFPHVFASCFNLQIETFLAILLDLQMLSYYNEHTVGVWKTEELLNNSKLCKKYGCGNLK